MQERAGSENMKKRFLKICIMVFLSTLLCQLGMYVMCLPEGSVMHMPSVGNTAVIGITAFIMAVVTELILNNIVKYNGRTAAWFALAGALLLAVTISSLLHPLQSSEGLLAFRYPSLAVLAFGIICCELFSRRFKPDFRHMFRKPDLKTEEAAFASIAAAFGIALCVFLPADTMISWDDTTHYWNTVYYSQGIYTVFDEADTTLFYRWDDETAPALTKEEKQELKAVLLEKENNGTLYVEGDVFAFRLNRVGYLGPTVGIWLGQLLKLGIQGRLTLARVCSLALYIAVICLAMKQLKRGKTVLAVVALAPSVIMSTACLSYDAWLFSFVSLSFACFFGELQRPEEKLTKRAIIMMLGAMLIGCWTKPPYIILILALLFMPKEKFASRKQRKLYYWGIIFCIFFALCCTYLMTFMDGGLEDSRSGNEIDAVGQLLFILQNPLEFLKVLFNFNLSYFAPSNWGRYLTDWAYIGSTNAFPLLLAALALAALADGRDENSALAKKPLIRLWGIAVLFIMAEATAFVFYLSFSSVGSAVIEGCQLRYRLHMLFPLIMFLLSDAFPSKPQLKLKYPAYAACILSFGINLYSLVISA